MTWKDLAARIAEMPADVQHEQANVFDTNTGEELVVESLDLASDWCEPANHKYTIITE